MMTLPARLEEDALSEEEMAWHAKRQKQVREMEELASEQRGPRVVGKPDACQTTTVELLRTNDDRVLAFSSPGGTSTVLVLRTLRRKRHSSRRAGARTEDGVSSRRFPLEESQTAFALLQMETEELLGYKARYEELVSKIG